MRILVVEDEETQARALVRVLEGDCYAVDLATDGATAAERAATNDYQLVILDWSIPGPSGIDLLRAWRRQGLTTPVLMLTGRTGVEDRVGGLDSGADDYLTKPYSFDELLARVRSLLRRRQRVLQPLSCADVEMDRAGHRVRVGGEPVELTPREFALLEVFLHHAGEVLGRADLAEMVWDEAFNPLSNVVDVTVHRLRRKIDGDRPDRLLHTVPGAGYLFGPERR